MIFKKASFHDVDENYISNIIFNYWKHGYTADETTLFSFKIKKKNIKSG